MPGNPGQPIQAVDYFPRPSGRGPPVQAGTHRRPPSRERRRSGTLWVPPSSRPGRWGSRTLGRPVSSPRANHGGTATSRSSGGRPVSSPRANHGGTGRPLQASFENLRHSTCPPGPLRQPRRGDPGGMHPRRLLPFYRLPPPLLLTRPGLAQGVFEPAATARNVGGGCSSGGGLHPDLHEPRAT